MTLAKYKCKLFVFHELFCLLYKFVPQIDSLSQTQNKNKTRKMILRTPPKKFRLVLTGRNKSWHIQHLNH